MHHPGVAGTGSPWHFLKTGGEELVIDIGEVSFWELLNQTYRGMQPVMVERWAGGMATSA